MCMEKIVEGGGRKPGDKTIAMVRQLEGLAMSDDQDPEKGRWCQSQ